MATGYTNSVPLGQEGTGAAQIIGPNRALQYALGNIQRNQDRLYQEQQRYQAKQQAYGDQFQKTLFEMNELANTPMFQGEFSALTNALVQQGAQLRSQGVNPYNPNQTPESAAAVQQFNSDMNKVKQAKTLVDNLYAERKALVNKYNSNPSSYDFDEYSKIKDFEKNFNLQDVMEGRAQLPALSEIYDIGKGLTTKYGEVYTQGTVMDRDAQGNPIRREVKEADKPRIATIINSEFTKGTPAANEVDRRLRSQFGDGATIDGLLGTTDREAIKSVLDSQFRNDTSDANPIVELMSKGKIPALDSPEYDRFLDEAVNEQLKAERVLDDAKQQAANSLIGKVNTKDTWKFDFSLRDQARKDRAESRAEAKHSQSMYKGSLEIGKLQNEISGAVGNISDVTIRTANDTPIVLAGATSGSTTEFEYNPTKKSYNVDTQKSDTNKRESAKLMGVGVVAIDKNTGVVYPGDPRDYIGNPNAVFETRAQVRAKVKRGSRTETQDFLEDPTVISNSLAGENKKFAQKSISTSKAVVDQFNAEHNKALGTKQSTNKTQSKTKIEW